MAGRAEHGQRPPRASSCWTRHRRGDGRGSSHRLSSNSERAELERLRARTHVGAGLSWATGARRAGLAVRHLGRVDDRGRVARDTDDRATPTTRTMAASTTATTIAALTADSRDALRAWVMK